MQSNVTPVVYSKQLKTKTSIIVSAILIILLVGSVYISQLIFQEISKSFNIDILEARNVFSLACCFYAISFFIYGPLSDRIATRLLVLFGCIGTVFCLGISGIISSFNLFLFIMSLLGFFAAAVPAALFAYTARNTPNEKLPQTMGVMISASIIGIIFSRSMIAMLTDYWSWQVAFMIYACLIICACFFIPFAIKKTKKTSKFSISRTYIDAAKLLLNHSVIIFLIIGFILFFVYLGLSSILTFHLKSAPFYLSSTNLGWLNFVGLSATIGATLTGKLSQFMCKERLLIICLLCVIAPVIMIGFSSELLYLILGIFCLFLIVFGIQPILIAMLNQIVTIHSRGAISSLYLLFCLAGGSLGTYTLGILYENWNWISVIITCIVLTFFNAFLAWLGIQRIKK